MWYRWKTEPDELKAFRKTAEEREVIFAGSSNIGASEKPKLEYNYNESVASFKRVRMLSQARITWLFRKGDLANPMSGKIFGTICGKGNATINVVVRASSLFEQTIHRVDIHIPSDMR